MKKTAFSTMLRMAAAVPVLLTIAFTIAARFLPQDIWLTLAITFGTTGYHFCMRLLVGLIINAVMHNRADYHSGWFTVRPWETKLYEKLKVKQWKHRMPTYDSRLFDPKLHSWDEIAQAMCQAEAVHEIIAVFSFLPIIAIHWFGAAPVFIITSFLGAALDLCFVILQRFNRPRVIRLAEKTK